MTATKQNKTKRKTGRKKPLSSVLPLDGQKLAPAASLVGLLLRYCLPLLGTAGLTWFLTDALAVELPVWMIFAAAAAETVLMGVLMLGLLPRLIALGLLLAGGGIGVALAQKPLVFWKDFAVNTGLNLYNVVMMRLASVGYRSLPVIELTEQEGIAETACTAAAFLVLSLLLCAVLSLCSVKKVRLLPVMITGGAVCVAVFIYNITRSNWPFALILTVLCGFITLKLCEGPHDRVHADIDGVKVAVEENTRRSRAVGGWSAGLSMLCAILLLAVPAAKIHKKWKVIDAINNFMMYERAFVSSVIVGDVPNLSDLGYLGNIDTLNARTTVASDRSFTGKEMLQVRTAYDTPVYLRTWVGTYYSDNAWYSESTENVNYYHNTLFGSDFSPEDLTIAVLSAVDPDWAGMKSLSSYINHTDLGYLTMAVDVEVKSSTGNVLYLPSMTNISYGFLNLGTRDLSDGYGETVKNYHEGIVTTTWFNFDRNYRLVSLVPTYRDPEFDDNLDGMLQYYRLMMQFISENSGLRDAASVEALCSEAEAAADSLGWSWPKPSMIRRYFDMSEEEKKAFLDLHEGLLYAYREYVSRYYLMYPQSDALESAVSEIFGVKPLNVAADGLVTAELDSGIYGIYFDPDNGEILTTTHDKVMKVVDYLAENYTYTLTPAENKSKKTTALDSFLSVTKEGYCVQYATAAAMILRRIGVPARYCEGYIASGFTRDSAKDRIANCVATVRDYNAHAWIEVWVDDYGWMTYEVTPSYYSDMYEPLAHTPRHTVLSSGGSMEDEILPEAEETDLTSIVTQKRDLSWLRPLLITLAVTAVCAAVLLAALGIRRASATAREERLKAISQAMSPIDASEARPLAMKLGRALLALLAACGVTPESGEQPSAFAVRADEAVAELKKKRPVKGLDFRDLVGDGVPVTLEMVMPTLEKAEFGGDGAVYEEEEIRCEARLLQSLTGSLTAAMNPVARFWNRYARKVI